MKEIDSVNCGDCKFFKYEGSKYDFVPNESGLGRCTNPNFPSPSAQINATMTPRQSLSRFGLTDEINRREQEDESCFKTVHMEFSEEALDAFMPTPEEKRQTFFGEEFT